MASIASRRLAKELSEIKSEGCPVGINLVKADDFSTWWFTIEVMGESLYQSEVHTLQFRFDAQYPISSPAVQFVVTDGRQSPVHPVRPSPLCSPPDSSAYLFAQHVYSNGHICASILGNEWSPVLSVIAVCVTLQSMLASCKKKERPIDNDRYVRNAPDNPKKTQFEYHGALRCIFVGVLSANASDMARIDDTAMQDGINVLV
ncbi:putative ubiquitin-conjugating enzyme E2 W [Mycena sanguinolenta]|uniref:Putative ubiquitin-conjugating enzyme E2 W n=1 Tax=Mycena sanguinolenta TaxID=230812 RepID=A0A8H7DDD2_9AGAR|nr:putative ubiquitin-conjugating enzyme E2 W [Mycena sanguinolenta]